MTGVEVLAIEKVAIDFAFSWGLFGIIAFLILGAFVLFGLLAAIVVDDIKCITGFGIVGLIFAMLLGFACGDSAGEPIEYENQYKVIISDEVSMNEFIEKYEIIEQEGKIYTVRERE